MSQNEPTTIQVRVGEMRQLFSSVDPSPFRDRDLDPACEEFIVSWARELRPDRPFRIAVHLEREPAARTALAPSADPRGPRESRHRSRGAGYLHHGSSRLRHRLTCARNRKWFAIRHVSLI